jgi:hypothetical protein
MSAGAWGTTDELATAVRAASLHLVAARCAEGALKAADSGPVRGCRKIGLAALALRTHIQHHGLLDGHSRTRKALLELVTKFEVGHANRGIGRREASHYEQGQRLVGRLDVT